MERITTILRKLDQLRAADPRQTIFGAEEHQYQLNQRISEDKLDSLEKKLEVTLPQGYRDFLLKAGNGGAGPYQGIAPLRSDDSKALVETPDGGKAIFLSSMGCGYYAFLQTSGEVCLDYRAADQGISETGVDFLSWYEDWLDGSFSELASTAIEEEIRRDPEWKPSDKWTVHSQAIEAYARRHEESPDALRARTLIRIYERRFDAAAKALAQLDINKPSTALVHCLLHWARGDLDSVLEIANVFLQIAARSSTQGQLTYVQKFLWWKASALAGLRKVPEAIEVVEAALEKAPHAGQNILFLAYLQLMDGEKAAAATTIQEAFELPQLTAPGHENYIFTSQTPLNERVSKLADAFIKFCEDRGRADLARDIITHLAKAISANT